MVSGESFELVFLSDQPERRRKWKTFTRCNCMVSEGSFNFETYAGLVRTPRGTFEEYVSFAFGQLLRSRVKYWHAHVLDYMVLDQELHTVKDFFLY